MARQSFREAREIASLARFLLPKAGMQNPHLLSRRASLRSIAGGLGATLLGSGLTAKSRSPLVAGTFRFAFLTDIHAQPEREAGAGWKKCVNAVNQFPDRLDFAITGGDLVMDSLVATPERIAKEWAVFDEGLRDLRIPCHHTIGNHDIGGWSKLSHLPKDAPEFGKSLFIKKFGYEDAFHSHSHLGWHFIHLDSVALDPESGDYYGWIDEAQERWLKADLERVGKKIPIVVITHIPFFSIWNQMHADPRKGENPKSLVNNANQVRKILNEYNVRLVLCGHGHVVERIQLAHFNQTTFIQGGAVCGMWWKGRVAGNPEGFGVVTCHPDGRFEFDYHDYGWTAVKPA